MYANPEDAFGGTGKLLALVELIYSTVDDASLWPSVLTQIAETVRGRESLLFASFPDSATSNISCTARMDPVALTPYGEYYHTINVLSERCDRMFPDGTTRFGDRAVPDPEFEKTEFCNDYFAPNDMHYSMGMKVPLGSRPPAYIAIVRPKRKHAFGDDEGAVLETLMPHLQRALMLHLKMSQLRLNAGGLESSLDAFGHAVFGLNRDGRVVLLNRQAEKIAASGDGLRLSGGCLTAAHPEENKRLQARLSEAVAAGTSAGFSSGGSLSLSRRSGRVPLRLTAVPYQSHLVDHYGQLAALVFVSDPETAPLSRSAVLRSFYGLTPTEARIADLLAKGHGTREVAAHARVTLETARFHVKRVLAKTGARRQAELVRLMLSLPGE